MRAVRSRTTSLLATLLVALLVTTGCSLPFVSQGPEYTVHAEFDRAISLYPGSPVRVLGIEVGEVTEVENKGDVVEVTMDIEEDTDLPDDAFAVIVPVTALGERYVQLGPVYEDGPTLERRRHHPARTDPGAVRDRRAAVEPRGLPGRHRPAERHRPGREPGRARRRPGRGDQRAHRERRRAPCRSSPTRATRSAPSSTRSPSCPRPSAAAPTPSRS